MATEHDDDYKAARLSQVDSRIADLEAELSELKERRKSYAPAPKPRAKKD